MLSFFHRALASYLRNTHHHSAQFSHEQLDSRNSSALGGVSRNQFNPIALGYDFFYSDRVFAYVLDRRLDELVSLESVIFSLFSKRITHIQFVAHTLLSFT